MFDAEKPVLPYAAGGGSGMNETLSSRMVTIMDGNRILIVSPLAAGGMMNVN